MFTWHYKDIIAAIAVEKTRKMFVIIIARFYRFVKIFKETKVCFGFQSKKYREVNTEHLY